MWDWVRGFLEVLGWPLVFLLGFGALAWVVVFTNATYDEHGKRIGFWKRVRAFFALLWEIILSIG